VPKLYKNKRRIDPRYFLEETVTRDEVPLEDLDEAEGDLRFVRGTTPQMFAKLDDNDFENIRIDLLRAMSGDHDCRNESSVRGAAPIPLMLGHIQLRAFPGLWKGENDTKFFRSLPRACQKFVYKTLHELVRAKGESAQFKKIRQQTQATAGAEKEFFPKGATPLAEYGYSDEGPREDVEYTEIEADDPLAKTTEDPPYYKFRVDGGEWISEDGAWDIYNSTNDEDIEKELKSRLTRLKNLRYEY
jgi:hypothetical protein